MLLYMTKKKQNNVLAAVIKDSEVMRLPWIIQVGPIDTHLYLIRRRRREISQRSRQGGDRAERCEEGPGRQLMKPSTKAC